MQTKQLTTRRLPEVVNTIVETLDASPDDISQEEIGASWGQ